MVNRSIIIFPYLSNQNCTGEVCSPPPVQVTYWISGSADSMVKSGGVIFRHTDLTLAIAMEATSHL